MTKQKSYLIKTFFSARICIIVIVRYKFVRPIVADSSGSNVSSVNLRRRLERKGNII